MTYLALPRSVEPLLKNVPGDTYNELINDVILFYSLRDSMIQFSDSLGNLYTQT